MGALVAVVFGLVVVGMLAYGGFLAMRLAIRGSAPPPVAPARIANPHGAERVYARSNRALGALAGMWRVIMFAIGAVLMLGPTALVIAIGYDLSQMKFSKGRVLRIRNRARLAEPAAGDAWSGDAVALTTTLAAGERAVLGELWLLTARMEHASVAAFSQLALQLSALGAPAHLLEATHRAALDEIRHTRACFAIVRAIIGVHHTAGPIRGLGEAGRAVDLVRLAVGSLVDGCLGEGIAADVAAHGARTSGEPAIRDALAMIAREEATHAELAWDVLAWCVAAGDDAVRDAVAARCARLDGELAPTLPPLAGIAPATLAHFGVIDQDTLGALATGRIAAVRTRAETLLDVGQRRAA